MTKEKLLKIFKLEELYKAGNPEIPFTYYFSEIMGYSGTTIIYYFYPDEIRISIATKEFSKEDKKQEIFLVFKLKENEVILLKNKRDFQNTLFPFLDFKTTLEADLEFISGVTNNILIPKYNLNWKYSIIENYEFFPKK